MKKFSIVAAFLAFASSAMACPNLAGTYVCNGGMPTYTFSQTSTAPITYTIESNIGDGGTFVADGKTQSGNSPALGPVQTTASCEGDVLTIVQGMSGIPMSPETQYSLDAKGSLVIKSGMLMNGSFMGNDNLVCERK